jgi:hypothetical protein
MALTRRSFLRNLGVLASALSVGLTVTMPQRRLKAVWTTGMDQDLQAFHLVGYKGSQFLETGAVYAPYIPIYKTPDIVPYISPKFIHKYAHLTSGRNLLQLD